MRANFFIILSFIIKEFSRILPNQWLLQTPLLFLALSISIPILASEKPGTVSSKFVERGQKYAVVIRGAIVSPVAEKVQAAIDKIPKSTKIVIFHLDSLGGHINEGEKIIQLIEKLKKQNELNEHKKQKSPKVDNYLLASTVVADNQAASSQRNSQRSLQQSHQTIVTFVENEGRCGSMCVPIFMQGERRYAGAVSAFMFHGVSRGWWSNEPHVKKTEEMISKMIKYGISRSYIQKLRDKKVFTTPGHYWTTGEKLKMQRAGVITHLLSHHVKLKPWSAPFDPQIRPR